MERNWQVYNAKKSYMGVASLNADAVQPVLSFHTEIAHLIKDDETYELLFDKENFCVGVRPSARGLKSLPFNRMCALSAMGFCRRFGLTGKYYASSYALEGDILVLKLEQMKEGFHTNGSAASGLYTTAANQQPATFQSYTPEANAENPARLKF